MERPVLLLSLVLALVLVAGTANAMSSTNFRLDWYEVLTGAGGPRMTSATFAADVTAGQSAIATSASTNYGVSMGYWSATFQDQRVFLPLAIKN